MRKLAFVAALPLFALLLPAQTTNTIGGEKTVTLHRTAVSKTMPEFTSVTLMPGRGMELLYITANFPGKGEVPVLASPDLATAKEMLDQQDDADRRPRATGWARRFWFPIPIAFAASSPPTARR